METIKQVITIKASEHDIFEALMDEQKHGSFTGASAKIDRAVGGKFSAYDGWIEGENVMVVKDKKIVQTWRCTDKEWPKKHNSQVTFVLKTIKNSTQITFTHTKIPTGWSDELAKGWKEYYWKPLKKFVE